MSNARSDKESRNFESQLIDTFEDELVRMKNDLDRL